MWLDGATCERQPEQANPRRQEPVGVCRWLRTGLPSVVKCFGTSSATESPERRAARTVPKGPHFPSPPTGGPGSPGPWVSTDRLLGPLDFQLPLRVGPSATPNPKAVPTLETRDSVWTERGNKSIKKTKEIKSFHWWLSSLIVVRAEHSSHRETLGYSVRVPRLARLQVTPSPSRPEASLQVRGCGRCRRHRPAEESGQGEGLCL